MTRHELKSQVTDLILNINDPKTEETATAVLDVIDEYCDGLLTDVQDMSETLNQNESA